MDEVNAFEQQLLIGLKNNSEIPADVLENAIAMKKEVINNPQSLPFLIQNFLAFKDPLMHAFVLQVLIPRLQLWAFLDSELIEPIRLLLFQSIFQLYDSFDDDIKELLGDAQSQFSIHQYPENWEDMWTFIFSIPNRTVIRYFLHSFCRDATLPTPSLIEHFTNIKQHIKTIGAEQQILTEILQGMTESSPISFSTLASFCHWANLSFMDDETFKQAWAQGFQLETTAASAADICTTLISRSMPIEQKIGFIQSFNIIELLGQICMNHDTNTAILRSSALACSTAGRLFLEFVDQVPEEILQQIFSFSLQLFQSPINEVATAVSNFLYTYTQRFDDVATVLESVMQRLVVYFNSLIEQNKLLIGGIANEFSRIAFSSIEKNPDALQTLVGLMGENPTENPSLTASVLYVLPYALKIPDPHVSEYINQVIESLKPLLEITPPFSFPLFFVIYNQKMFYYFLIILLV